MTITMSGSSRPIGLTDTVVMGVENEEHLENKPCLICWLLMPTITKRRSASASAIAAVALEENGECPACIQQEIDEKKMQATT